MAEIDKLNNERPKWYIPFIISTMAMVALLDNTLSLLETAVISLMEEDFGFEKNSGEIQIWLGAFGIISFGVFFLNWFADAYGRKKGLFLLVIVMGIPAMLLPLTPSGPAGLIPSMLLYSFMTLATQANSWEIPVTEEVSHEKRGLLGATPFLIGLLPIYAIAGEPIAIATGSWKSSYAILGGIMTAICLVMLVFMKETKRWQENKVELLEERKNVVKMLKHLEKKDWKYVLLGALAYFTWGVCFKIATLAVQPTMTAFGYGEVFSTYLTIGGLSTILGALLSGIIMDKISRKAALITGCIGGMASYILFGVVKLPWMMIGIYLFMPMILAYITVYFLGEIFPTKIRATCSGTVITLSRLSYIIGPILAGTLISGLKVASSPDMWMWYWIIGGLLLLIPLSLQYFVVHYETSKKTLEEIEEER